MRIAYLGAFTHSWSTEQHVAQDAETLGHHVTRITATKPSQIQAQAEAADILVCHRTGLDPSCGFVWQLLETAGTKTCSYHLDLYIGLKRATQVASDPFWRTSTVFTADGDPYTAQTLRDVGVNHKYLPAAVCSSETQPGEWRDEFDHDVVFVGSKRYHPEHPWRGELLDHLARRYGPRFRLFDHHPPTRDQDLNDLYATARVVVGDSLCLPGHTRYFSDRIFETLGRGGALAFPYIRGLDELGFRDRDHVRYYTLGDLDSVDRVVDEMLDHPEESRLMAKRGNRMVAESHTYKHRVRSMLDEA